MPLHFGFRFLDAGGSRHNFEVMDHRAPKELGDKMSDLTFSAKAIYYSPVYSLGFGNPMGRKPYGFFANPQKPYGFFKNPMGFFETLWIFLKPYMDAKKAQKPTQTTSKITFFMVLRALGILYTFPCLPTDLFRIPYRTCSITH